MFFWKKKKKEEKRKKKEELSEQQIEQIIDEYMSLTKEIVGRYLPRRMRRALSKNKGWGSLSASERKAQIKEVKQEGLSSWLEQTTEETFEEISSFVSESVSLEEELRGKLKEFKKKWNIK